MVCMQGRPYAGCGLWDWVDPKFSDTTVKQINTLLKSEKNLTNEKWSLMIGLKRKEVEVRELRQKECVVNPLKQKELDVIPFKQMDVEGSSLKLKLMDGEVVDVEKERMLRTLKFQNSIVLVVALVVIFATMLSFFKN